MPQAARLDDDVAEPRTGRNVDLDLFDLLRRLLGQQILVGVQPRLALGLAGARRHADPVQLTLQRALALALGLLFDDQTLLLLVEPGRVVAFPGNARAAIELEDPAGDVVEEVAVVRDRDDGSEIVLEEPLQPGHRLGVEMVGRLVEQQQVGRLQQQPAEGDAPALAAGQRGDVGIRRRQPQRVHRQLEPRIEVPAVGRFDLVLDLALLVEHLVHLVGRQVFAELRVDLVVARQERTDLGHAFLDVAEHRLGRVEPRLLLQKTDADALGRKRLAEKALILARHDAQQRALARPVQPQHANLRARQKRQPDVFEYDVVGLMDLAQPFHGVDELRHVVTNRAYAGAENGDRI